MNTAIVGFIALVILYVVVAPVAVIWSMNTLFPVLNIATNFDTWCSIVVLGAFIRGTTTISKK